MANKNEKEVVAGFNGKEARVTKFEHEVYKACLKIPRGKTATYKEIAAMIGRPGAARAVGNALGKNPFAPFVPCHRVLKSDGSLGGYSGRGGVATKKKLLEKEKKRL
ncbi:MAG: MGMT family protein [Candidatus Micrarchaeia archaeon]